MSLSPHNPIFVTAIVPARNEEAVIAACVESLAQQEEIGEIVVVNDQSTDRTAAVVQKLMQSSAKLKLLESKKLPAGWVGKNYAVWLGAREAIGNWLLFTDADAVHKSDSAAKAVAIAERESVAMVSFSPEQVMESWYEKALIPYVYCRLASKFVFDDVNNPEKGVAAANGQFLMIRREAYEGVGGHESVAGEILEDVALAKRVKGAGYRIWFGSGKGIVRVRMYRTFSAMWEGWRKNLYPLMGGRADAVGQGCIRALLPTLLTAIAVILGWSVIGSTPAALGMGVLGIVGSWVAYGAALKRNQFPAKLTVYGIPGGLLFAGVLWASFRSHRKGKLEWKGREYPLDTPGASK